MSKKTVRLKDYQPPAYRIDHVDLTVEIDPSLTRVTSVMDVVHQGSASTLWLDGRDIELVSVAINGTPTQDYRLTDQGLAIDVALDAFELTICNTLVPKRNLSGEGFYPAGSILCTQCEAEGFRKITYFIDRPDNMATFTTKMVADAKTYPYLLSNGNAVDQGALDDGRHYVTWEDPFKKPSYLFAMVAGDLAKIEDQYQTVSGKEVQLEIYVDHGNQSKAKHAMASLKKAMAWDETRFGLEYDLNIYMIVAVDSFNMGAMENKGLNIFNSVYTLADQDTAEDVDFQNIQGVIGHEYFHNWTGNRVTCRDWFQLTLKEGLTVFRDQEFSSDMGARSVKRISDVMGLRSRQFPEDASALRHPIRPLSYQEINNFYTATVYQKGAEVIRMIHSILGEDQFMKGMRLYFERHDGQAVTTEDFVSAMQDASNIDLTQFRHWYSQCGTPHIQVKENYDAALQRYTLCLTQSLPEGNEKSINDVVLDIPLRLALFSKDGQVLLPDSLVRLDQQTQTFVFSSIDQPPILSINRNFTAPVMMEHDLSVSDCIVLMQFDTDPINRHMAAQRLHKEAIFGLMNQKPVPKGVMEAFVALMEQDHQEHALTAQLIKLPSEHDLNNVLSQYDVEGVCRARKTYRKMLAERAYDGLGKLYASLQQDTYTLTAQAMGRRALKNQVLSYLVATQKPEAIDWAYEQYTQANNMTDQKSALCELVWQETKYAEAVNQDFYEQYQENSLVMNKWLAIQTQTSMKDIPQTMDDLASKPVFDATNPNKLRSLYGAFTQNLPAFHDASGQGYAYMAEKIQAIDAYNPQVASGLAKTFGIVQKLDPARQHLVLQALETLLARPNLSSNLKEVVQSYVDALSTER
jgi:aminopeptidase N